MVDQISVNTIYKNQNVKNVVGLVIVNMERLNIHVKIVVDHRFVYIKDTKMLAENVVDQQFVYIISENSYAENVGDLHSVNHHGVIQGVIRNMMVSAYNAPFNSIQKLLWLVITRPRRPLCVSLCWNPSPPSLVSPTRRWPMAAASGVLTS